jgi:hypothetical protein
MTRKTVPPRAGLTAAQTRDIFYAYDLRGLQIAARFDSLSGEGVTKPPAIWFHDAVKPDGTPYREREAEIFRSLPGQR